jgi:putative membrane protein
MSTRLKKKYKRRSEDNEGEVLKGLAAGIVGGLVASWTMNQFQALWSRLAAGEERSHGAQSMQQGSPEHGIGRELQERGEDDEQDTAPARLAQAISVSVFDRELTKREKELAGTAFHYAMGTTSGALYGAVAEIVPEVKTGAGLPFGAFIWLTADEGLIPAVGLSKSPTEYPLSIHAYALASHLVYGLTTELVRRAVRNAL